MWIKLSSTTIANCDDIFHKTISQSIFDNQILRPTMSHPAEEINQSNWTLADGEYHNAIASLTRTLKTLKLFLSGDCHTKIAMPVGLNSREGSDRSHKCSSFSLPSTDGFDYDFFSLPNSSSFVRLSDSVCIGDNFESRDDDNNATCPLSQPPLQLRICRDPLMALNCKPLDMQVCRELTYVALYNLALCYHLKSLETETSSPSNLRRAHLRKALSLYELSQVLQMEKPIMIRGNAVHSMALVSNIRHIHHELGHPEKVRMCSEHLLATMMYILHCGKAEVLGRSLDEIIDVILPLISQPTTASAA